MTVLTTGDITYHVSKIKMLRKITQERKSRTVCKEEFNYEVGTIV